MTIKEPAKKLRTAGSYMFPPLKKSEAFGSYFWFLILIWSDGPYILLTLHTKEKRTQKSPVLNFNMVRQTLRFAYFTYKRENDKKVSGS